MKAKQLIGLLLIALMLITLVYSGCQTDEPKGRVTPPNKVEKPVITPPTFLEDSAYAFIAKQVAFGPRVPNSAPHQKCGEWLTEKMKQYGATVTTQTAMVTAYDGTMLNMKNIIAAFQPEKKQRVLLCAHWDTRPYADKDPEKAKWKKPIDGANDGASGVGVLLEVARMLQQTPSNIGVDMIFFDAEDYGSPEFVPEDVQEKLHADFLTSWCLGSQYWARNVHQPNYNPRFGILLDMVGAADAQFNQEEYSLQVAGEVVDMVWRTADKLGYGSYFQQERVRGVIDDHVMLQKAGIRCIDIIDTRPEVMAMGLGGYRFGGYHHTHKDNMEVIDKSTLKAVGQTLMQVIYNL